MPPLPEAIILVLAPFAPLFSQRVWLHAQRLLLGAMLAPGARTVTAALRVMGLATERGFTNYHRVLNRDMWSALQGSRLLLEWLMTLLVPAGATIVLGADDTVERRSGRKITAKGCYRDAVRSTKKHVIRCFGLKWVAMMLLVPVPWARRVWAMPFHTALCRPAKKKDQRRHKTSVDWVRQMIKQVRRWPVSNTKSGYTQVGCDSELGQESTFWVKLPADCHAALSSGTGGDAAGDRPSKG